MVEASISANPVIRIIVQRGDGDCGIASLASYLGMNYEDVLAAAVASTKDYKLHKNGMYNIQIVRIAKFLGITLHRRKRWDYEESCGILSLDMPGESGHVVVLKNGLIFDPADGCCWQPEAFLAHTRFVPYELLTQD